MSPDRETKPATDNPYTQILRRKEVEGSRIYPNEVVDNILERTTYLEKALNLQKRADKYMLQMAATFDIEEESPVDALDSLTRTTLQNASTRINEMNENLGRRPKVFLPLAGPGGAGKDTVFDNAVEALEEEGIKVGRVNKYTTRDSSRPGAYHFRDSIVELHEELGDVSVTEEEVEKLKMVGVDVQGNSLGLKQLQQIENLVDKEDGELTEWNLKLDRNEGSLIEFIYRRNRGWYATDGREILKVLEDSDIAVITGNPQNLARMMDWVKTQSKEVVPLMTYVLPAYPSQFTSAARSIARDGLDQSDKSLLSTTGPRQTDEMGIFADLVANETLDPRDVIILENDRLLSNPAESGRIETLAGQQLAECLLGEHKGQS